MWALATVLGIGAALPAKGADAPTGLDALVAAAKSERELLFYTTMTDNISRRLVDAFRAKYDIKIEYSRIVNLQQRYASEMDSGAVAADLGIQAGTVYAFAQEGIKKGWVQPIAEAHLPVVDSGEFPSHFNRGATAVVQIYPWVLGYNRERVGAADVPKDWPDVLAPKYKGQILVANPASSSAYLDFWTMIYNHYGEPFFEKLRAQAVRWYGDGVPAAQALGAGEGMLQVPISPPLVDVVKEKGAPLESSIPDLATGIEMQVFLTVPAKSNHPNAARLLANFLMSNEGGKVINYAPGNISVYDVTNLPKNYESPQPDRHLPLARVQELLGSK